MILPSYQEPSFDSTCLFIVAFDGELLKLSCPFKVMVIQNLRLLQVNQTYEVQAVVTSREGILVYYVASKPFYYFNFKVLL